MATIGKVRAVFTASTSGLTSGVNTAAASMRKMEQSVGSLRSGMNALVAIQGAQFLGSLASGAVRAASALASLGSSALSGITAAVGQATDLGEETSKSAVIFGAAAGEILKFSEGASAIGLTRQAALQATGSFGNLFTAMGLGSAQAAEYAQRMTALGADLASFNNATVEDSVAAIGAALRGEAEPIRRFGVLLDEATLKQAALAAGLIKSTSGSLTPAIKAQAAYAAILQQTTKAQGDFARTGDSLANLTRVVQAQTGNMLASIGSAFQPLYQSIASAASQVLSAIEPFVSDIAEGIQAAVSRIAAAMQSLVPVFLEFVGTFDGKNVGQAIGDGILQGARFLAGIGDWLIANLGSVWQYVSGVGAQWNSVVELLNRGAAFLSGVFNAAQAALGMIILGFGGVFEGLATIAQSIGKYLGFDTSSLDAVVEGAKAFNNEISDGITQNVNAASADFGRAFGEGTNQAGAAIAGPLTTALDSAIAQAEASAAAVDEAGKGAADSITEAAVAAAEPQAVKGVDSRSSEGIAEMFRIMRGDGGDVQERQLGALERIADAVESDEPIFAMEIGG